MEGPAARGACPGCGAPIAFGLATSAAQVCAYCRAVVVRTDRDLRTRGRVADLLALASPLGVGGTGSLFGVRFRVFGRVQYDRAQAAGAPWQELYVGMESGRWCWLAQAQGRWYATALAAPAGPLPSYAAALPGVAIDLGALGRFVVAERQPRRTLSGEGELPFPIQQAVIEAYADLSGPGGQFATLDFGDGTGPPQVFVGRIVGPGELRIDAGAGAPIAETTVATAKLTCPGCGGELPLGVPERAERVVCRYCNLQSDVTQGALVALRKLAPPPVPPAIPLGARGTLRGEEVTCIGFLVRGTTIDDERFHWREYLLYTARGAFVWLLEEDGEWQHIVPVELGDIAQVGPEALLHRGARYTLVQSSVAEVESVLGEFYWKIEVGERVDARSFEGPGGTKLEEERTAGEITASFSTPIPIREVRAAFALDRLAAAAGPSPTARAVGRAGGGAAAWAFWLLVFGAWSVVSAVGCARAGNVRVFDQTVVTRADEPPSASGPAGGLDPGAPDAGGSDSGKAGPGRADAGRADTGRAATGRVDNVRSSTPRTTPASSPREGSFVSEPFEVTADGKDLVLHIGTSLQNDWIGADIALVHDESGQIWEDSAEISYYSGVEDGESWSEGSQSARVDYAKMPAGHYVLRIETSGDPGKPPVPLAVQVDSDTPPFFWMLASLGALIVTCFIDRAGASRRRARGEG